LAPTWHRVGPPIPGEAMYLLPSQRQLVA
jgi:hypothetical protein